MTIKLKRWISCCHCRREFVLDEAKMCSGCNPCDFCRNARSVDECCMFRNCTTHTLKCPHCGNCACDKIDQWESEGRIVEISGHERFQWVHKDVVSGGCINLQ